MNHLLAANGSSTASSAFGVVFLILLGIFGLAAYWAPTIVALFRWKDLPNGGGIIVLNFFGFTVVCWIVALVMAVRSKPQPMVYAPPPGFSLPQHPMHQPFPQPAARQEWPREPKQPS